MSIVFILAVCWSGSVYKQNGIVTTVQSTSVINIIVGSWYSRILIESRLLFQSDLNNEVTIIMNLVIVIPEHYG